MFNAAILNGDIIENVIVLNELSEYPGAVVCPDWLGIGDNINTPEPEPIVIVQPITTGSQTL
jgi:hypothetical protein